MYQIKFSLKWSEQILVTEGCVADTGFTELIDDITLQAVSIDKVLKQVTDYFQVSTGQIILNSCGEKGRIDVSRYETDEGEIPMEQQLKDWEKGQGDKLYLCVYTGGLWLNEAPAFPTNIDGYEY